MGQKAKSSQKYINLGDRGRYCIHNKLNDLTGKEWIIYSKSFKVIQTSSLEEFFKIIAEKQISFFTKQNQTVLELLSHTDILKEICEKIGRKYHSIPAKDDYFLGKFEDIDLSSIPKADYIISIPFSLITLTHEKIVEGFITDYKEMMKNLVSFYKLFLQCLQPKKYLSVIANNFYIENQIVPFAFEFSSTFGKIIKQSDELVFIYNNKENEGKFSNSPYSVREHIYSFQFKNEGLPSTFKSLTDFL